MGCSFDGVQGGLGADVAFDSDVRFGDDTIHAGKARRKARGAAAHGVKRSRVSGSDGSDVQSLDALWGLLANTR